MKVFGCINQQFYGGGLILVAANTKEEAYLTAAMDDKITYLFEWINDDDEWIAPDGDIDHCVSATYPCNKWFEAEHLYTDLLEPEVIIESSYSE